MSICEIILIALYAGIALTGILYGVAFDSLTMVLIGIFWPVVVALAMVVLVLIAIVSPVVGGLFLVCGLLLFLFNLIFNSE